MIIALSRITYLYKLDQPDIQRISNLQDAKQKIATYQLWKSQLIFTLAEKHDNYSFPVPIRHTSAKSQVMIDEGVHGRS